MSEGFRYVFRVRYGECDAQRVVFNARYADYVDVAVTEYFRQIFGGTDRLEAAGYDTQVVRLCIEWKSPARYDDVLLARLRTARIGTSSFTIATELTECFSGRLIASAEAVYVLVCASTFEKRAIPDPYRRKLAAGAPGTVINHAGAPLPAADSLPRLRHG